MLWDSQLHCNPHASENGSTVVAGDCISKVTEAAEEDDELVVVEPVDVVDVNSELLVDVEVDEILDEVVVDWVELFALRVT